MAGYRPLYTVEEDIKIVQFIAANDDVRTIKGNQFWKNMENDEIIPGRTWQSLKNRWLRYISLDLTRPEYGLSKDDTAMLKAELRLGSDTVERHKTASQIKSDQKKPDLPLPRKRADLSPRQRARVNEEPEERAEGLSREDKDFYSLDMSWSDSDTE